MGRVVGQLKLCAELPEVPEPLVGLEFADWTVNLNCDIMTHPYLKHMVGMCVHTELQRSDVQKPKRVVLVSSL